MKRVLLLVGVIITLVFSTPYTLITAIALSAADNISEYSTVQQDLDNFGLTPDDYLFDSDSNRQVSCYLFVEDIEEDNSYYYLYLYDPKGFNVIPATSYSQIQISHLTSNFIELLDDTTAVERALNYYDLTFLSISDNNTVAKYLINDLRFSESKTYRRYQLRQITYYYNNSKYNLTFGDEYLYETLTDGSITYQYKKMDYVTLYNVILDSYIIDVVINSSNSSLVALDKLSSFLGGEFYLGKYDFYGFSLPEDLDIDDLISVDFCYYEYDWTFYKPGTDFDKTDIFRSKEWTGFSNSKYDPIKSNPIYYSSVTIEDYEVVANIDNKWLGSQKNKWNTISTYDELKNLSNDEMRKGLMNTFKNCDYIVNYAAVPCFAKTGEFSWTQNGIGGTVDPFYYALNDYNENISDIYNGAFYTYSKYTTKYFGQVETVKLSLNSNGRIYDLAVIVAPQDSPDNPKGANPNKNWFIEFWEKLCKWIEETFDVESPLTEIIAIIFIVLGVVLLFMLALALIKLIAIGAIKLLFDGIIAILTLPFNLFKKKEHNDFRR